MKGEPDVLASFHTKDIADDVTAKLRAAGFTVTLEGGDGRQLRIESAEQKNEVAKKIVQDTGIASATYSWTDAARVRSTDRIEE